MKLTNKKYAQALFESVNGKNEKGLSANAERGQGRLESDILNNIFILIHRFSFQLYKV